MKWLWLTLLLAPGVARAQTLSVHVEDGTPVSEALLRRALEEDLGVGTGRRRP